MVKLWEMRQRIMIRISWVVVGLGNREIGTDESGFISFTKKPKEIKHRNQKN